MAGHAEELGVDSGRIIVMGGSAGGGFAAGVCLLVRDRKGPGIVGQLLICPILGDRNGTPSSHQTILSEPGTGPRRSSPGGGLCLGMPPRLRCRWSRCPRIRCPGPRPKPLGPASGLCRGRVSRDVP
ncbi:alpha/beta hydrolase fold domain-containing protein [Luethyella okanaganae]|uniref:Alpha/beta hydrolase fold domain-containing protein n=1 Tax=Luethyella okanaganae TaxID=69372 RepID=A0ABW1VK97_9MICO